MKKFWRAEIALCVLLLAALSCDTLEEPLPTLAPTPEAAPPLLTVAPTKTAPPSPTPNLDKFFNGNLLINGDAESDSGNGVCKLGAKGTLKGWQVEAISLANYGSAPDEPSANTQGPTERGACYFRLSVLGTSSANPQYSLYQIFDVTNAQGLIDAGKVKFTLSGFFSRITHEGTSHLKATFKNATGKTLSVAVTPSVAGEDISKGLALIATKVEGLIPNGARSIEVRLQFQSPECETCEAALFADNLSFTLSR